jgi:hypothetical protein
MGYFSNGTEGESYQADYCSRCVVHERGCAVWFLHMMHNYEECNKEASFLHVLIPRSKDKLGNERCTMFVEKPQAGPVLFPTHCDRCGMPYHGGACLVRF